MKKIALLLAALMIIVVALTACSSSNTAQDYVDAIPQADMDMVNAIYAGLGMTVTAEAYDDNTVVFIYQYDEQQEEVEFLKEMWQGLEDASRAEAQAILTEMRDEFDIEDPVVRYVYRNADGTEIWSVDFS